MDGGEGADKSWKDGVGMGDDVQGCGSDGATPWEQELGIDRGSAEGSGEVPASVGLDYCRYVRSIS